MKKILSLLIVGLFYFSTMFAQVNMDNYVTLTMATGKTYNFSIGGAVANTPIRVSDGTNTVDANVGDIWSGTSVPFTTANSTVTLYGDIANILLAWNANSITGIDISNSNTLKVLNFNGSATLANGLNVISSSIELMSIEFASMPFIDVSQAPKLQTAEFYSNKLKKLDISNNPNIRRINIGNNLFTACGIDSLFHQLPVNTVVPPADVRDYRVNVSYAPGGVENNGAMQVAVDGCRETIATNKNWRVTNSVNVDIVNEGYYTCPIIYTDVKSINSVQFSVFPNPAKDFVTLSAASEIQKIQMYDLVGKLLLNVENLNSNELTLPITASPGTYFIKLSSKEGNGVQKIVVE